MESNPNTNSVQFESFPINVHRSLLPLKNWAGHSLNNWRQKSSIFDKIYQIKKINKNYDWRLEATVGADCAQYSTAHAFTLPRSFSRWPCRTGNPFPTHFQASKPLHSPSQKKRIALRFLLVFSLRPARVVAKQYDRPILKAFDKLV